MTCDEGRNLFSTLYNNILSNQSPGLDDYEISVFLTLAQDRTIKAYYNKQYNKSQEGFDDNSKRQIDFSTLVTVKNFQKLINTQLSHIDKRSELYDFPLDVLAILTELLDIKDNSSGITSTLQVVPINYAQYNNYMATPYKWPLKNQAWRLLNTEEAVQAATNTNKPYAELIARTASGENDFQDYTIRYIRYPLPIIISDLDDGNLPLLSIRGRSKQSNYGINGDQMSELSEEIQEEIVQKAVELAAASFKGELGDIITLGQYSATEQGIINTNNKQQ